MRRAKAIILAVLCASTICSPAAAEWSIPKAEALRKIVWTLTKPRPPWRAINEAARKRIGDREVIAYRGFSAKVDNFDLMSYLEIDDPQYNRYSRRQRLAEIRRRWKSGGLAALDVDFYEQKYRLPATTRLFMCAAEEPAQILKVHRYGKTRFRDDNDGDDRPSSV